MNPVDFIRKNIAAQLAAEGFSEQVALGGGWSALTTTAGCRRQAVKAEHSTIVFFVLANGLLGRQQRRSGKRVRKKPDERANLNPAFSDFAMQYQTGINCYRSHSVKNHTNKHQNASSVNAENLPDIQWQGARVVTTETLAAGYGTKETNIRTNLDAHRERFVEGVHYFTVDGSDLANLRVSNTDAQISNKARSMTFWTERGAARMSKIVDTDEAWSFFEKMESAYFRKPVNAHPVCTMPDFSDEVAAARAWADEREAARRAIGYVERQAKYIEHLENLFQPGMSPCQFCKQLNGVNVQQVNAFLFEHNWLYDDQPKAKYPRWRVNHYARDLYLSERTGQVEQDDGEMRDTYKPILLRKGAVWIYRHYLKGHLPMKKCWDGKFTHDTEFAGAA